MKVLLVKPLGKLVTGETLYTRTEQQGKDLIEQGVAEVHPGVDETLVEKKRVLYQDTDGGWKVKEVPATAEEIELDSPAIVPTSISTVIPPADTKVVKKP